MSVRLLVGVLLLAATIPASAEHWRLIGASPAGNRSYVDVDFPSRIVDGSPAVTVRVRFIRADRDTDYVLELDCKSTMFRVNGGPPQALSDDSIPQFLHRDLCVQSRPTAVADSQALRNRIERWSINNAAANSPQPLAAAGPAATARPQAGQVPPPTMSTVDPNSPGGIVYARCISGEMGWNDHRVSQRRYTPLFRMEFNRLPSETRADMRSTLTYAERHYQDNTNMLVGLFCNGGKGINCLGDKNQFSLGYCYLARVQPDYSDAKARSWADHGPESLILLSTEAGVVPNQVPWIPDGAEVVK